MAGHDAGARSEQPTAPATSADKLRAFSPQERRIFQHLSLREFIISKNPNIYEAVRQLYNRGFRGRDLDLAVRHG